MFLDFLILKVKVTQLIIQYSLSFALALSTSHCVSSTRIKSCGMYATRNGEPFITLFTTFTFPDQHCNMQQKIK